MFGGDEDQEDNNLWGYDVTSNSWFIVPTLVDEEGESPEPQLHATLCGSKASGRLVLISGVRNAVAIGGIWKMDAEESSWSNISISHLEMELSKRWMPQTWCDSDTGVLYLFGGFRDGDMARNYPGGMWRFNITTLMFEKITLNGSSPTLRYGGSTWVDINDTSLWLLGGRNRDGALNDLWQFDTSRNEWKEIQRPETLTGIYGELGVLSKHSHPGARINAFTWVDECGNLWLFGGSGYGMPVHSNSDRFHDEGYLSDLWMYVRHKNAWVWMGGNKVEETGGKYGNLMFSSPDFLPGPRFCGAAWSVNNTAYLFGGAGHNMNGSDAIMNDLWQLDMGSQCNWTFGVEDDSEIDINPVEMGPTNHSVASTHQPITATQTMKAEPPVNATVSVSNGSSTINGVESVATDKSPTSETGTHPSKSSPSDQPMTKPNTTTEIESTNSAENKSNTQIPDQLTTQTDIQPSSNISDSLMTHAASKPTSRTRSESTTQSGLEPTTKTGDESTARISSKPASEAQIESTNKTLGSPTTQVPVNLVSEIGSESTAQTGIKMSTQVEGEVTTQVPIETESESRGKATVEMSVESAAASQSNMKSTSKTTTNTPTEPVTEMGSESVAQDRGTARVPIVGVSSQSQSEMTTEPGSEPLTQISHKSSSKTEMKPTQIQNEITTEPGSEPLTQISHKSSSKTEMKPTQIQNEITTEPGSESFSQTSHKATSQTERKPTVQTVSEMRTQSRDESTSLMPTDTASETSNAATTQKQAAGNVASTHSTESAETQPINIHISSESRHDTPTVELTESPTIRKFKATTSTPFLNINSTEAESTQSSKAVEFGSTELLPSNKTKTVSFQTGHSVQTQQSTEESTSESSTTEAVKTNKPFKPNLSAKPNSPHPTVQSSSDWGGSRKLVPFISVGLVLFAVLLLAAGVFLGKPYCRQKRKTRKYNYQKVASDDLTEWQ